MCVRVRACERVCCLLVLNLVSASLGRDSKCVRVRACAVVRVYMCASLYMCVGTNSLLHVCVLTRVYVCM